MDKLTFLLIIAGIGVVLLVAMFTYYKHHKKINDEIESFNQHSHDIDDVLLKDHAHDGIDENDLPSSFSANRNDNLDLEQINLNNDSVGQVRVIQQDTPAEQGRFSSASSELLSDGFKKETISQSLDDEDKGELVDGVYINTKRVIRKDNPIADTTPVFKTQTDTFAAHQKQQSSQAKSETNTESASGVVDETVLTQVPDSKESDSKEPDTTTLQTNHKVQQTIKIIAVSVPEGVEDLIISHSILSKDQYFTGTQLYAAFERAGLKFGEMNIYHYPGDNMPNTYALFSVANIVEPGTFDPDPVAAEQFSTPGISIFMRLPAKIDNYEAYEQLLVTAQQLAKELDGELCDETRSQLTRQAISYKKEQIRKLNFDIAKAERLAGMNQ